MDPGAVVILIVVPLVILALAVWGFVAGGRGSR